MVLAFMAQRAKALVRFADLNGDGHLDLYMVAPVTQNMIFFGQNMIFVGRNKIFFGQNKILFGQNNIFFGRSIYS